MGTMWSYTPECTEAMIPPSVADDKAGALQSQNITCDTKNEMSNESVRLISFSDNLSWEVKCTLAHLGIYLANADLFVCHFCHVKYDDVKLAEDHVCTGPRDGNISLPQDETNFRFEINRIITFLKKGWTKEVNFLLHSSLLVILQIIVYKQTV
jgi:hypothetical protein